MHYAVKKSTMSSTSFASVPIFKYLLIFCLLIFCDNVIAQINNISGIVVTDSARLNGAEILNLKMNERSISDIRGFFFIKARKGDTIITKILNYKTDTLTVNNQYFIVIKLKPSSRMLKEVVIKNTSLTPLEKYNENKKEYKDIYWKGDKSKMFQIGVGMVPGVGINIDKLYSALSKQGKDARRLQKILTQDYQNDVVDQRFTKSLVGNITGYKGEQLDDFIIKYRPSYEFVSKVTKYDIIQYIKKELAIDINVSKKTLVDSTSVL